jgi:hypothetical protein
VTREITFMSHEVTSKGSPFNPKWRGSPFRFCVSFLRKNAEVLSCHKRRKIGFVM